MFAVLEFGGKQYRVSAGSVIKVEKLNAEPKSLFEFDNILLIGDKVIVGESKAKEVGEVLENTKTDKVIIFKKKRRHNYRRKRGHRQNISVVRIKSIEG